ncbi:MAG: site-specific DNA-methyltransferase [Prevotellaceae bacterium]|jgi:DNA modification methylase|nr:site-specific DNA-methyltransferase [Prevotellaceae bacterium]
MFSYIGGLVFDSFAGSATTLLVAQNLDRKSIGTEIDQQKQQKKCLFVFMNL